MSSTEFTVLARWDWRAAVRLTETGMCPVDVALTFVGLAAAMQACAETIGAML